jgi:hypothetical protein
LDFVQNGKTIFIAGGTKKVELARLPDQRCATVVVTERDQPAGIMAGPKE